MKRALLLVSLPLAVAAFAAGFAEVVVNGNGSRQTIRNRGANVTVNGNKNTIRVAGSVPTLRVAGNGNVVRVDRVGAIDVPGNENRVEWTGSPSGKPKITNLGNGNTIIHR